MTNTALIIIKTGMIAVRAKSLLTFYLDDCLLKFLLKIFAYGIHVYFSRCDAKPLRFKT